jgi:hypothetical protein
MQCADSGASAGNGVCAITSSASRSITFSKLTTRLTQARHVVKKWCLWPLRSMHGKHRRGAYVRAQRAKRVNRVWNATHALSYCKKSMQKKSLYGSGMVFRTRLGHHVINDESHHDCRLHLCIFSINASVEALAYVCRTFFSDGFSRPGGANPYPT